MVSSGGSGAVERCRKGGEWRWRSSEARGACGENNIAIFPVIACVLFYQTVIAELNGASILRIFFFFGGTGTDIVARFPGGTIDLIGDVELDFSGFFHFNHDTDVSGI
ncbi:hypothetical protein B9Z55_012073 [Caenorhabditis nigoni]|uniref:Uncharacterized protein n=1 Tax=Caenorhabditis nigoni TaxID=1611254 RepID=A0A2G5TVK2_9PELO|nr:hypothetical protein B9Z55_012073 [Caenorhabditis nigoni]